MMAAKAINTAITCCNGRSTVRSHHDSLRSTATGTRTVSTRNALLYTVSTRTFVLSRQRHTSRVLYTVSPALKMLTNTESLTSTVSRTTFILYAVSAFCVLPPTVTRREAQPDSNTCSSAHRSTPHNVPITIRLYVLIISPPSSVHTPILVLSQDLSACGRWHTPTFLAPHTPLCPMRQPVCALTMCSA